MHKTLMPLSAILLSTFGLYMLFSMTSETQKNERSTSSNSVAISTKSVPQHLTRIFSHTDFSKVDPDLAQAVSGGPGKDGIPSIDTPSFVPLGEFTGSNDIQVIVLTDGENRRVYPYNILTWHEIVNDTVDGTPVAITFCPLCGSAIVFNRTLPDGQVTTFGVSGSLLESNMIMYDRLSESLWQQSTGKTLAGLYHEAQLEIEPFQLLTLGKVRENYPDAQILSTDTGYRRDYTRNPYAGYETDDRFVFEPSTIDRTFNPKEIMVVFSTPDKAIVSVPWDQLREQGMATSVINSVQYTLTVDDTHELEIFSETGTAVPFYYEMWFSVAAQHGDAITLAVLE